MESHPLVSIVMCAYNGQKYISEQLDSLVNQTYENLEIIIVDDVSSDRTVEIVKEWMAKDTRIFLHQNTTNLGYNRNFESAVKLAKGDYIALSDQDDVWFPQKIERLLSVFEHNNVVLAHARSVEYINGACHYPAAKLLPPFSGNDPRLLVYDNQIGGHKIMFKRSLADKISPIPPNMFYDWWIGVLATCNGGIAGLDEYLVKYRIHGENSHVNVKKEIRQKHIDHITAWTYFVQIKEMKPEHRAYIAEMTDRFREHRQKRRLFDYRFFIYLLKNRNVIFANRKKLENDFLNLKFIFYYAITSF